MKKFVALVMMFLMVFSITAVAEEHDLANMTLDELIQLRKEIDHEILLRTELDDVVSTLPIGDYICGEHIKPGRYLFTNPASEERRVRIFDNQEMFDRWEDSHYYALDTNQSAFVDLKEGMIIRIVYGDLLIETANLPFEPQ